MLEYPGQDTLSDLGIPEGLVPLGDALVQGQDQYTFFIPPGDEVKEQMRAVAVDRDAANLVTDPLLLCRLLSD